MFKTDTSRIETNMILFVFLVLCFSLFLYSCAANLPAGVRWEDLCGPEPTIEQAEQSVQDYIDQAELFDPLSAQVRNISVLQRTYVRHGTQIPRQQYKYGWDISFELNAKNRFGGYVGFEKKHILRTENGEVISF